MKLSEFAKSVKKYGEVRLYNLAETGDVILTDGYAAFVWHDLPRIKTPEELRAVLDIPQKKWEETMNQIEEATLQNVAGYNFDAGCRGECALRETGIQATGDYKTLATDDGRIIFFDPSFLSPIKELLQDAQYVTYWLRQTEIGTRYIVIKEGMEVIAMVMPVEKVVNEAFLRDLAEYQNMCIAEWERTKGRDQ